MRDLDARIAAGVRIGALWFAFEPLDMCARAERMPASVVPVFCSNQAASGRQAIHPAQPQPNTAPPVDAVLALKVARGRHSAEQ